DARRERDPAAFDKVLVAGLCAYFENPEGAAAFARGAKTVRRAEDICWSESADLRFWFAVYWVRAGDHERALYALDSAMRRGYDLEKMIVDPELRPLHGEPAFQGGFVERVYRWRIKSTPPGARLWLDGVDTGQVTPAKLRAPKVGVHEIKLVLAD